MRPQRETEDRRGCLLLSGGGRRINGSGSRRSTHGGVTQPVCVSVQVFDQETTELLS